MRRRSSVRSVDESFRIRHMMRPSIARMTLDLDYGDMGMEMSQQFPNSNHRAVTEALQHRLAELLVFEIRQDGETRYNSLSVRGLYKYVLKSIKVSAEKRPAIRGSSNEAIMGNGTLNFTRSRLGASTTSHRSSKRRSSTARHHRRNSSDTYDNLSDDNAGGNDSDSSDDEDRNYHHGGLHKSRSTSSGSSSSINKRISNANSIFSEGKNVTFGPILTGSNSNLGGAGMDGSNRSIDHNNLQGGSNHSNTSGPVSSPRPALTTSPSTRILLQHDGPVTYRERLGGFLHPRDMRRLVTPFSASNEPELIVRRHVMLLNFDPLRAVILRDRLLVLVPDGADSLLVDLEKRVRGGTREIERDIFGETGITGTNSTSQIDSNIGDSQHSSNVTGALLAAENNSGESRLSGAKQALLGFAGGGGGGKAKQTQQQQKQQYNKVEGTEKLTKLSASFNNSSSDNDVTAETTTTHPLGLDAAAEFREWEEMVEARELSFELTCVDAVLGSVCGILGKDSTELQKNSIRAMDNLLHKGSSGEQGEEILRHMKNSIKEMTSRVKGFIRAMNLVLDETEDMALMNLSRLLTHPERFIQPVPEEILNEESDEPELILEAHLQHAFSLTNSLDLVRGEIQTTQELINQRLDAVRNRLLLANMIISIGSLVIAFGSFIGSIFGMNVVNHIENSPTAFETIVLGTCLGMVSLILLFGLILWAAGTLPSMRSS